MDSFIDSLTNVLNVIDDFVWGPVMLVLLVGTGIFLTIRTKALCWRNLPYALKSVLSKEARQKKAMEMYLHSQHLLRHSLLPLEQVI